MGGKTLSGTLFSILTGILSGILKCMQGLTRRREQERKRFVKFTAINMIILLVGLSAYWIVWGLVLDYVDMTGLQAFITNIIYLIQSSLGWPVEMAASTMLYYGSPGIGFNVEIIALCLGIGEMLFLAFLVLLFRGATWKAKAKGLAIFLPITFLANLARLLMIYPLAEWIGINAMWDVHWHIWKWGMFVILMIFFGIWYLLIARKDIEGRIFR